MSCHNHFCSCSLCPSCGTKSCPYYEEISNKKKEYYIYAHDKKGGYLDVIFHSKNKIDIINKLASIASNNYKGRGMFQGEWAKKYRYIYKIDKTKIVRGRYPIVDVKYVPYVEFIITQGEANWNNEVNLVLDIENSALHYYDSMIRYGEEVKLGKKWNNKLVFSKK